MAFKIGNKIAISDNSVFNVTDTSDSDGGVVNSREGNLNLDLSTGSIFTIPNPGTNKARLKEKLTMSNFPTGNEIKKITVAFNGRGAARTSATLTSGVGTPSTKVTSSTIASGFTWADNGNYFFWDDTSGGRQYCKRYSCPSPYDLSAFNNNNPDQNVRFDTGFKSIPQYTYPSNSGMFTFNDDGTKIYFSYMYATREIWTFSLSSPYDLNSTKTLIHTFSDIADYTSDTSPDFGNIQWLADGHVLFGSDAGGSPNSQVLVLYVDTPYDLSTVYGSNRGTLVGTTNYDATVDIAMNYNGDRIFICNGNYWIDEYTLSTPFDPSTVSGSYTRFNSTQQAQVGQSNTAADIWTIKLVPSSSGVQDTYLYVGDRGATDVLAWYTLSTSTTTRSNLIWDSDRISMLNDSAPPMPGSGEYDLYEFLVFDSATGAKQASFINNV